jgi:arsenite methyltransferase
MTDTARGCCGPDCCGDEPVATLEHNATRDVGTTLGAQDALRDEVKAKYGAAARRAASGQTATCGCGTSCTSKSAEWDPITSNLYEAAETDGIPAEALLASLGCGNPTALAALAPGETVLDLGSGGGIDVLLSAHRVGPTGKAYGLDMTDDMPDSVDVIISNCVINLSADKARVLREAHRVLNHGGRFAVSDVVLRGDLPESVLKSVGLWTACISGALHENEYQRLLHAAGFTDISIEPTRVYSNEDVQMLLDSAGLEEPGLVDALEGNIMSAFVRATKA